MIQRRGEWNHAFVSPSMTFNIPLVKHTVEAEGLKTKSFHQEEETFYIQPKTISVCGNKFRVDVKDKVRGWKRDQTTVCSNQEEEEEKEESLFHHMSHNVQQSETGTHTRHTRCEHQLCVGSNTLAASFITTTRCCSNTSGYTQLMQLNAHFTFWRVPAGKAQVWMLRG